MTLNVHLVVKHAQDLDASRMDFVEDQMASLPNAADLVIAPRLNFSDEGLSAQPQHGGAQRPQILDPLVGAPGLFGVAPDAAQVGLGLVG